MARITRESQKTFGNVFDAHTERVIIKLISQGHLDGLQGPLSIGKESNVFIAQHAEGPRIVKIFRLEACDFNQMFSYIRTDPRYLHLKGHRRKVIFSWTQREYRNLLKARLGGVRIPAPYAFYSNVLVEEFIGNDDGAAPKLKDLYPEDPAAFYEETARQMELLAKAGLVHGDLSPFNILNHGERPVIIDMSQATMQENPLYLELLERDCRNVTAFFRKIGTEADEKALLSRLTSVRPENIKDRAKK